VLAALLLVFFWQPLTRGGYYAGADLLQYFPLFQVGPGDYVVKNHLLGDTVVVMFPSLRWNASELAAGRLPLWNPYNGWGVPHLGNYQSSLFSVYTLPYLLLPFRWALLAAPLLKLLGLAVFTLLFLRRIAVGHTAALVGTVAFTFAGYNVLWLQWPLSSAVIVVPAGMYCAEVLLQMPFGHRWRAAGLLGFTLALTAGLLSGHPETFFFGALLVGAWILFRVAFNGEAPARAARRLAEFAGCAVLALALSAVQLLPFLEYLRQSSTMADRQAGKTLFHLLPRLVPLQFFPNLLGNPSFGNDAPLERLGVNFIEANGHHIGLTALFLAGWAVLSWPRHRSRTVAFFAAVLLAWSLWAYNVAGITRLASRLPVLGLSVPQRSSVIWLFGIACLAALAVDAVAAAPAAGERRGRWRTSAAIAIWGVALAAGAVGGAHGMRGWMDRLQGVPLPSLGATVSDAHVRSLVASLALAVAAFAWLARPRRSPSPAALAVAGSVLVAAVFHQSGFLLRHFNPTIDAAHFYPDAPVLRAVLSVTQGEQTLFLDKAALPANANLWYQVRNVRNYDGMGAHRSDVVTRHFLGRTAWDAADRLTLRGLQVLGVRHVVTGEAAALRKRIPELIPADGREPIVALRVPRPLARYYTVPGVVAADSDESALRVMADPQFDIRRSALLHARVAPRPSGAETGGARGAVSVLDETPTRIRLRAEHPGPGWLVALVTHFPGWTARVNGREAPITRANVAFMAVPIGDGSSEVVLEYAPASVRHGAWLSASALVVAAAWAAIALAAKRRPPVPAGG
jgi:hypothetical protein